MVYVFVHSLSQEQCTFAVKGGGVLLFVGSNDIQDGVTIDLGQMKNTTLSKGNTIASVQAGAKWGDVYKVLGPLGYAVPGSKGSNVGVGGSTLGGGLSFYNSVYGWIFDRVRNFEIVLGNGTIINVNAQDNTDLFKALKGGIGNFGIVTRFDFLTFTSGPLWGGLVQHNISDTQKFYQPTIDFINNNAKEPDSSLVFSITNNATAGTTYMANAYEYIGNATEKTYYAHTDPPGTSNPFPAPFAPFTFDKVGKPTTNSLRVDSLYNIAYELNGVNNSRYLTSDILFKSDTKVFAQVDSIVQAALKPYIDKQEPYPYTIAQALYQPVPSIINDISIRSGGNVLGLDRVTDNSISFCLLFTWDDPAQDAFLQDFSDAVLRNITTYLKSVPGGFRDWQFAGLASVDQDVIGSYGQGNIDYLKRVSQAYDPDQVFQKLVPGGWKLGDAGKRNKQFNFNHFVAGGSN